MLPAIDNLGKPSALIDLFVGSTRIESSVTIGNSLLKKMCTCSDANRITFRVKSEKAPAPASVKKLLLVFLESTTIEYKIENNKIDREEDTHGQMLGFLEFSTHLIEQKQIF